MLNSFLSFFSATRVALFSNRRHPELRSMVGSDVPMGAEECTSASDYSCEDSPWHPDKELTPHARACSRCGAIRTPMWRKNAAGEKTLCNACGVWLNPPRGEHVGPRPVLAAPVCGPALPELPLASPVALDAALSNMGPEDLTFLEDLAGDCDDVAQLLSEPTMCTAAEDSEQTAAAAPPPDDSEVMGNLQAAALLLSAPCTMLLGSPHAQRGALPPALNPAAIPLACINATDERANAVAAQRAASDSIVHFSVPPAVTAGAPSPAPRVAFTGLRVPAGGWAVNAPRCEAPEPAAPAPAAAGAPGSARRRSVRTGGLSAAAAASASGAARGAASCESWTCSARGAGATYVHRVYTAAPRGSFEA
ncbi:hypothetical protein WJX81_004530 [Elliptochloris bilobata]|uniref:GATA-type domain-containing protein n=1 Tax=Elliptochloris bilobata TaxID=381761 RepID=A0AAW1SD27_9CHLO